MEAYLSIALDSFLAALIGTLRTEIAYPALVLLGDEPILTPTLVALLASMAGFSVNFWAIKLLLRAFRERPFTLPHNVAILRYALLLAIWHPLFGPLAACMCALLGGRYLLFLPLAACVKLLGYAYLLL